MTGELIVPLKNSPARAGVSRGDPGTPHGAQTTCNGNGDGIPDQLQAGVGFQGRGAVYYEAVGCPADDTAFLQDQSALPDTFHEVALLPDGIGGVEPWVATSFEHPIRGILSRHFGDGSCSDFGTPQNGPFYPGEQLTDEFGGLVVPLRLAPV